MSASIVLATLLAVAAPQQTAVRTTLSLLAPIDLVLDGRHYAIPVGGIEVRADGSYYILPTLAMADCVRPANAAQVITKNALRWAAGLRTVYLAPANAEIDPMTLRFSGGAWTLNARSATGDIACAGEVMPAGVIFWAGFE